MGFAVAVVAEKMKNAAVTKVLALATTAAVGAIALLLDLSFLAFFLLQLSILDYLLLNASVAVQLLRQPTAAGGCVNVLPECL